jgi:hypothetical protein
MNSAIAHPVSIHRVDPFGVPSRYRSRFTRASSSSPPSSLTACAASITQARSVALTWREAKHVRSAAPRHQPEDALRHARRRRRRARHPRGMPNRVTRSVRAPRPRHGRDAHPEVRRLLISALSFHELTTGAAHPRRGARARDDEFITPGAESIAYPTLLDFPAPDLSGYPRETVVAEKFHAMVTEASRSALCASARPPPFGSFDSAELSAAEWPGRGHLLKTRCPNGRRSHT